MNFTNVRLKPYPGVLGLKASFGLTETKRYTKFVKDLLKVQNPSFANKSPFLQKVKLNKLHYLHIKINLQLSVWGLKTSFGSIEPKRLTKP